MCVKKASQYYTMFMQVFRYIKGTKPCEGTNPTNENQY